MISRAFTFSKPFPVLLWLSLGDLVKHDLTCRLYSVLYFYVQGLKTKQQHLRQQFVYLCFVVTRKLTLV